MVTYTKVGHLVTNTKVGHLVTNTKVGHLVTNNKVGHLVTNIKVGHLVEIPDHLVIGLVAYTKVFRIITLENHIYQGRSHTL